MALSVRPATAADRTAVLAISAQIWEGHDYLPKFFDRWVREGQFWVGVERGQAVGCGKATQFARGEWWLEGLRVDQRLTGRGLGTALSRAILARALDLRPSSLRLATADVNEASIHIIEKMGFRVLYSSRLFGCRVRPAAGGNGAELDAASPAEALDFLSRSTEFAVNHGLLHHTWQFRSATLRHVRELCRSGRVFGTRERGRLSGLLILRPHRYEPRDLDICLAEGSPRSVEQMRRFVLARARDSGSKWIEAMACGELMQRAVRRMGLRPDREVKAVPVYEYPI
ncbi:MAG: GNAT family N-acetyltransferase [bacterium]